MGVPLSLSVRRVWPAGLALLLTGWSAPACTLWGAAGECVAGQGTLIVKNRDWKPDHVQEARLVHPRAGLSYFGLFAKGGEEPGLKAGVNSKGLTVVTATAGSIPAAIRKSQPGKRGILAELLTGHDSVEAVLAHRELFAQARPAIFLLADHRQLAQIEVALDGKYAVRSETNGTLGHTNGYQEETLRSAYGSAGTSSTKRLERIKTLLAEARRPLTVAQFKQMSADQHDGPDNSLWRTGAKTRTLAMWLVESPRQGPPVLHLKIAHAGQALLETNHVLDAKFWKL
jgi:hypothetical protein